MIIDEEHIGVVVGKSVPEWSTTLGVRQRGSHGRERD